MSLDVINNGKVQDHFEELLDELREALRVEHIMTKKEDFVYYEDVTQIPEEYDILPLRDLKRYYDTTEKNPKSRFKCITIEDVISADTDLLTLLDLFKDRKFYFVKKGRDIVGLVHYSDLKKHPVRVLFYI